MKAILSISHSLTEEEATDFVSYLQKKNRRGDTKNIILFKLIRSGETKDLDIKIYGVPNRNAFHALSKRVQDALIDFIATKSFDTDTSEELSILKLLLAARIFFEHKQYKIACKTLEKAEKNALQYDVYAILNEIYHTKIQYAHVNASWDLTTIITAYQDNMSSFLQEQQLNMAYATLKRTLGKKPDMDAFVLINQTLNKFDISISKALTYKSIFQLMNILAGVARSKSNYYTVMPHLRDLYAIVEVKQELASKHAFYYLEILYIMSFSYFRNKDFAISQMFLDKMTEVLQKNTSKYLHLFEDRMLVLQGLNYTYSGKNDLAIKILQSKKSPTPERELTLVLSLFQGAQFKEAYDVMKRFYHSDIWYEKKAGWLWVVRKAIIEILVLIELDKFDLVLSRLQSFKVKFTKRLQTFKETRALTFINLVSYYYGNPKEVRTSTFKERVDASFNWIGREREDIFVMSFYAWLKAKMEDKNLYEVTLELVAIP